MPGPMGPRPGRTTEKAKDFKGTTKKLVKNYLSKYKIGLIIVFIFAVGSTIFSIIGPKILGNATTEIFNGLVNKISGNGGIDFGKVGTILLTLLGLYVVSALFSFIQSFAMTQIAQNLTYKLRKDLAHKINSLPMNYFDKKTNGEVLSIITNDIDTLGMNLNQSVTQIITSICTLVGILIMMLSISWQMTLISLIVMPIGAFFVKIIVGKSQKYFKKQQDYLGHVNGQVEEVFSGLTIVKAFNGEEDAQKEFEKANSELYSSAWKSQFLSGLMHPMMGFMGNLGYVSVCIVGAILTMKGYITFGVIVAFITYVRLFSSPLTQIAQAMSSLQSTAAASERVFEIFDEEELADESMIKNKLKLEDVKGKIEFKNVNFTYDGNETPTIKGFSALANPGEKVAIVGPTGAGKTTLVNLLMKFYDIDSGDILIDGVSIHDLTRENIHDLFTMVLQDTWLFEGTIKDNIVYNRKNISDKQIKEVCKIVGVDHFIKTLSEGYDSIISDNDSVSAGQRQLLTIARGMIKNAPFLILDEATSNVDTRTEELVQKAMDELTKGKTSFIIAHRLSTIKNANLILVMDHGNIIEQGTHEELLQKNGFYAKLYNSQFSGMK